MKHLLTKIALWLLEKSVTPGETVKAPTELDDLVDELCMDASRQRICPRCGSDFIRTDSNREMEFSEIRCIDCGLGFQAPVPEECIEKMWNCITPEDTPGDGREETT